MGKRDMDPLIGTGAQDTAIAIQAMRLAGVALAPGRIVEPS
jgi:hypothetical protein